MSGERPQREVAYRLFATEFEDSDFTYAESDEERAPNYVVTPTGARINRLFVVGVLTEVEQVSDDVLRARIVDPTGAFVVYAGQYQPEALAFFERTDPPAFVAVTGKARTFQPEDSDVVYTSIRPESANTVTAETRDRWVVQTAEQTIDRIETFAGALEMAERGDALTDALERRGIRPGLAAGIPKAMDHYGTTTGYLAEIHRVALDATRVVANELDEVETPTLAPDEGDDTDLGFEYSLPEPEYATEDDESVAPSDPGADETADGDADGESTKRESDGEPAETDGEPVDSRAETSPETETQADTEPTADAERESETEQPIDGGPEGEIEETPAADPGAETGVETDAEPLAGEATDDADSAAADAVDLDASPEDTEEMYDLSEEEREEVKSEFGVDFETGNEVGSAGEAGIGTPEPEEPVEPPASESEPTTETEPETPSAAGSAAAEDIDLEDVVVDTMGELDDGDGAPRDELVQQVVEEYDVDEDAVEDAIQDALMGGRCYEPTDDRITPI